MNYDWKLLRKQKALLLRITCDDDYQLLDGLVNMIDDIQDRAVTNGDATELEVFGRRHHETND
jgi:hypothetical protein